MQAITVVARTSNLTLSNVIICVLVDHPLYDFSSLHHFGDIITLWRGRGDRFSHKPAHERSCPEPWPRLAIGSAMPF